MSKNILADANEIISRAHQLNENSKCLWGSMTVSGMLYHGVITNESIFNAGASGKKRTLKQMALKFLVYNIMGKLPKGVKGNPKFLPPLDSEKKIPEERDNYIRSVLQFTNADKQLLGDHPVFGRLSTEDWRRFVYMHLDHHLRQFGV